MASPATFGRRGLPSARPVVPFAATPRSVAPAPAPLPALGPLPESVDEELRRWKQERRRNFQVPWRPLSLVAGLSFGIGSFVLPASINDNVQWLLYGLSAASLLAGFRKRRAAR